MSTTPTPAKKQAATPAAEPDTDVTAHTVDPDNTLDAYVYVSRTVTTVDDPDDDRAPGYVHIPGEEEPRLVDAKSVPELEGLGYRVVAAPTGNEDDEANDRSDAEGNRGKRRRGG